MGMIGRMVAGGAAREIGGVARAVIGDRAAREAAQHSEFVASVGQFGAEFRQAPMGPFDRFVDGLNRLPRPLLALGTLSLFIYAMVEPRGFALRMRGLNFVPEPLWWLLGAIVSFYFGARELHHFRTRQTATVARISTDPDAEPCPEAPAIIPPEPIASVLRKPAPAEPPKPAEAAPEAPAHPLALPDESPAVAKAEPARTASRAVDPHGNAAIAEWRRLRS